MLGLEATTEEADNEGENKPPRCGTNKEATQNQHTRHNRSGIVRAIVRLYAQHCKEGEDIRYYSDEVGHSKAKHRDKIAPRSDRTRMVTAHLRSRLFEEDSYSHNHHKHTSEDRYYIFVLLDLPLEQSVEEVGDYSQHCIGTRNTQAR